MNSEISLKEKKFELLAGKLKSFYQQYNFFFEVEYIIYNQELQIFSFCSDRVDPNRSRRKYMLTFNFNPGDIIWNVQSIDKRSITELMRVHNRTTGNTKVYSQSLFRGRDFFSDKDARTITPRRRYEKIDSKDNKKEETAQKVEETTKKILVRNTENDKLREEGRAQKESKIAVKLDDMLSKFKQVAEAKGWIKKR